MDLLSLDSELVWHPFTPTPPLGPRQCLVRAEGEWVFDSNGRRYFDGTSSWWCQIHGHCNPELVRALTQQASELDHVLFSPHTHKPAVELAELLIEVLGPPFSRVFYSDNGSTAVETALKMCWQYWKNLGKTRTTLASLEGAYHGDTLGAVSLGGVEEFHGTFQRGEKIRLPIPVNDEAVEKGISLLRCHRDTLAALFIEALIQGGNGMRIYPEEGLETLTKEAQRLSIPVVFDEVFTGFGRTGKMFAFQHIEARPDIICLAKGLTSGMLPLSATVVKKEIFDTFSSGRTFFHGHTFTGNPIGCAVAKRSLQLFQENRTLDSNLRLSEVMRVAQKRFSSLKGVRNARTLGVVWAIDLDTTGNELGWEIASRLWDRGIWLRPLGNVLYVIPPYCTTPEILETCFATLFEEVAKL